MTFLGMDPDEVRRTATGLTGQAQSLTRVAQQIDSLLSFAAQVWPGPDSDAFRDEWASTHQFAFTAAADDTATKARWLLEQVTQQELASDRSSVEGDVDRLLRTVRDGIGRPFHSSAATTEPALNDAAGHYVAIQGEIPLGDAAFRVSNMRQGAVGDCWFVSSAMAIGSHDPDWIRRHIHHNADGSYTVIFYDKSGKPFPVTVTASVASGGVTDGMGRPSWVSVYEKAAAQYMGGYDGITADQPSTAYQMITGHPGTQVDDPSLDDIKSGLASGRSYVAASHYDGDWWNPLGSHDSRIVQDHAYIVDKVEMHDGEQVVHLVNPWGDYCATWQGDHVADLWMTESEFHHNFRDVYCADSTNG